jgi:hypothetical protein
VSMDVIENDVRQIKRVIRQKRIENMPEDQRAAIKRSLAERGMAAGAKVRARWEAMSDAEREAAKAKLREAAMRREATMTQEQREERAARGREAMKRRAPVLDPWAPEDEDRIRREYPIHSVLGTLNLFAADLGRTKEALKSRAKLLGASGKPGAMTGRVGRFIADRLQNHGLDIVEAVRAGAQEATTPDP